MRIRKGTLFFALVLVFVISAASGMVDCLEKKEAENEYQQLRQEVMGTTALEVLEETEKAEVLKEELPEEPPCQIPEGLKNLMEINPSVVGWITIEDTNIDYPIVQNREDNEWFLHRDINGNKSQPGSIYLDSNHDMNGRGLHAVYGHRMKNGTMFKDISRFTDPVYLKEHNNE